MKRKVLLFGSAIFASFITYTGVIGFQTVNAAKNLQYHVATGNLNDAIASSERLESKFQALNGLLKLPIIKQMAIYAGLDVTGISSEISAIIKTSPYSLGLKQPQRYLVAFQNTWRYHC
jgi:hypothetical protein